MEAEASPVSEFRHFHFSTHVVVSPKKYFHRAIDRQPNGCIIFREMDAVFKALADESRRALLDQLHKDNGQTLGELCAHLDMTRQAVTKHLLLLEAANLVTVVWRGREKLHYLNPVPIHEISERWIGKYERHRLQALGDLKKGLEQNNKKGK
jgi:DNA-binding transcriptional ArsR family regulator